MSMLQNAEAILQQCCCIVIQRVDDALLKYYNSDISLYFIKGALLEIEFQAHTNSNGAVNGQKPAVNALWLSYINCSSLDY